MKRELHSLSVREKEQKRKAQDQIENLKCQVAKLQVTLVAQQRDFSETINFHEQELAKAKEERGHHEREARQQQAKVKELQEERDSITTSHGLEIRVLSAKMKGMEDSLNLCEDARRRVESAKVLVEQELDDTKAMLIARQQLLLERDDRSQFEIRVSRQRVESMDVAVRLKEEENEAYRRACEEANALAERLQEELREREGRAEECEAKHQLEVRVLQARIGGLQEDLKSLKEQHHGKRKDIVDNLEKQAAASNKYWLNVGR